MKQLRLGNVRPEEATGEDAPPAAVEGPGLKRPLKRRDRLLIKVQFSCYKRLQNFGDASTMGCPPGTEASVK